MESQRLTRPTNDRVFAGVCAGLANYVGMDPLMMRLAVVVLTLVGIGSTIPLYFLLWLIVPGNASALDTQATVRANLSEMRTSAESLLDRVGLRGKPAGQDWKFDPHTGQPIAQQPAQPAPQPQFDIHTGQPLDRS